ncbi:ABC transporter permease [Agrobacterium tumefaciens]|jgi:ribose transport system permease protein|uniref:ABC transporter, membrane spanning protein (Sugar) n=1 Tax=Agrobacterium fabrum (strain C58 / ATCC 33970) TaxID=176299 RepID=A9CFZ0_AGRFC|nr:MULTISPECIES: ABC transporter permease [Agrobacterium]KEY56300.1 ABC transporter permease [Agrobacterium tumefaciens]AAK89397.1 ABC transporter, membrane spanning protein (sugar) [Agrobacterium fabrum str. C58]EGL63913.1 ABC transporter, membrane spanning protein (sugar) [Agrobacterium sp. ATCC 31749]MCX2877786.1 ABC transporter permease [Agrobacterium fabrum]NMV72700.1 ABC transporter permease [Agrobacterium fabrum]
MNGLSSFTRKPWIWSFAATAAVWIITVLFTGGASSFGLSHAALTFAAFSVIVGIGQMFVITLGPGNIDLCVPATMTLSGTLALKFMDVSDSLILPGLLIAILIGIAIGIGNYALIKLLRIPPIIATLSMSFIVQSIAIWSNRGLRIKPPETLATFAISSSFGIPNVALVALLLSVIAWLLLDRTFYGRWIAAIGQSTFAARMTGIPVDGTRFVTYVLCAVLAAIAGYLLASFSGGAALNMGSEYLLMSIAVVVIGGTAVSGGDSNVPGIWGASLFMFLVVSMLNTYGFGAGIRLILTGLIIISVILLASGRKATR